MRLKLCCLFLLVFGIVSGEVEGPLGKENESNDKKGDETEKQTKTLNERKAVDKDSANVGAATTATGILDIEIIEEGNDEKTLETLISEELGLHGSAIKIVKAPDLYQEKEAQKVSDMLSTLVSSHAKLIKKFETEIEEIDGSIAALTTEEELPKVQTIEEIEAENLYETAMKIMNKTRSDKAGGFVILQQAASKGHLKAQAEVAWGQLMGNPVEIDFEAAKTTFLNLADTGLPEAHMVNWMIFCRFRAASDDFSTPSLSGFRIYACGWNWIQCEPI